MQISVKIDVAKALKSKSRFHRKQIPYATALGLSMTAKKVAKVEQCMMVKKLDRPTPFTVKGIKWQGAKKADFKVGNLHARVYLMDKQARYLSYQIEGGTRTPSGKAISVPTRNLKLNKYGNMIGGKNRIKRLLNKKNTFQGTINGIAGIWQRALSRVSATGGGYGTTGQSGLKFLVAYESSVTYQPRFDFYEIGERSVRKNISIEMDKAVTRALRSAK
jgi:hypothetical protein